MNTARKLCGLSTSLLSNDFSHYISHSNAI
jgi:hypothetical protein